MIGLMVCMLVLASCAPTDDKLDSIPGYGSLSNVNYYAGYLATSSPLRQLHYVFIENTNDDSDVAIPQSVTLWMNGGPGCSSKLGLLQEIAPFFLQRGQPYSPGDSLTANLYSWLKVTNLLFMDSPAGVGYSINSDPDYVHNDDNTATDNIDTILSFFRKFPEYKLKEFFIAGESYAGKYIPDLAVRIDVHNAKDTENTINIKGIFIGNGVLSFQDDSLHKSQVDFMISHNFIDPKLVPIWKNVCQKDEASAGCQFFYSRLDSLTENINPYNLYGPCYTSSTPSQGNFLKALAGKRKLIKRSEFPVDCIYHEGVNKYFNTNNVTLRSKKEGEFMACDAQIFNSYEIQQSGSTNQVARLLADQQHRIVLFNGDWDDVVPFTDTIKNLKSMGLKRQSRSAPWIINEQHAGFIKSYESYKLKFFIVKGAGHQVPQCKRENTLLLFSNFVHNLL